MRAHTVLDRDQRNAVRRQLRTTTYGFGDIGLAFSKGDRQAATRYLEHLQGMFALMDAVAWGEQPDAPDEQPVALSAEAAWWASIDRAEIVASLPDIDDDIERRAVGARRLPGDRGGAMSNVVSLRARRGPRGSAKGAPAPDGAA